jgi:hypothetical protein
MRRFQQLLIAASPGRQPWQPIPDAAIGVVATQCEPGDVDDVVAARDELAAEKSTLPEWDGDSRDDISRAQALFARLLLAPRSDADREQSIGGRDRRDSELGTTGGRCRQRPPRADRPT